MKTSKGYKELKKGQTCFKELSRVYRKIESGISLNTDEERARALFEEEHPAIRPFLALDYETLYDRISRAEERDFTVEMLRFLLLHYFDVDAKSGHKADLLNDLKKNTYNDGYNAGYMGSMKVRIDEGP